MTTSGQVPGAGTGSTSDAARPDSPRDTDPVAAAIGPVLAVDHVGIAVPDLDTATEFYGSMFGLREVHRETNAEQQVVEVMLAAAPQAADHDPRTRPAQLQLLAPLSAESPIATFLDRSGPGLQQLAFRVSDVQAAAERLSAAGLRVLYPQPRRGTGGSMINFVHPRDTGGVLIELVQPPAD